MAADATNSSRLLIRKSLSHKSTTHSSCIVVQASSAIHSLPSPLSFFFLLSSSLSVTGKLFLVEQLPPLVTPLSAYIYRQPHHAGLLATVASTGSTAAPLPEH